MNELFYLDRDQNECIIYKNNANFQWKIQILEMI